MVPAWHASIFGRSVQRLTAPQTSYKIIPNIKYISRNLTQEPNSRKMSQLYDPSEVAQNNGKNGKPCWLIIKGNVYDVTNFLAEHPGGGDALLEYGGKDASKAFKQAGHSSDAERDLKNYKIGELRPAEAAPIQIQPLSTGAKSGVNTITSDPEPAKKSSSGFLCCC